MEKTRGRWNDWVVLDLLQMWNWKTAARKREARRKGKRKLWVLSNRLWGGPDADGRIILRWIFRKWEGVVRTGWIWLRIGTGGGHL